MFITFEGVEGCGKTTVLRLVSEKLTQLGYKLILTREPGGCPISMQIRSVLLDAKNSSMTPTTELLLYAAARAQHIAEVIRPAHSTGIVLCDRFSDATRAYQASGRGLDKNLIEELNSLACDGISPDRTLLFDCPVELGLSRAKSRIESTSGPKEERFELEAVAFHQRVRDGYLQLADAEPDRFRIIDASQPLDEVVDATLHLLVATLPK